MVSNQFIEVLPSSTSVLVTKISGVVGYCSLFHGSKMWVVDKV